MDVLKKGVKIEVEGMFTTFAVSCRYTNLNHLYIQSTGHMEQFPFQDNPEITRTEDCERMKNLTSLQHLEVNGKLDGKHNLFGVPSTKCKNIEFRLE